MSAVIPAIIALLGQLIPALGSSATANIVTQIITILIQMIPVLIKEYNDLIGPVKNIIAALSANPATTAAQLQTLQALDIAMTVCLWRCRPDALARRSSSSLTFIALPNAADDHAADYGAVGEQSKVGHLSLRWVRPPYVSFQQFDSNVQHFVCWLLSMPGATTPTAIYRGLSYGARAFAASSESRR